MKRDFKNSSSGQAKRRSSPKKSTPRPRSKKKKPTPGWVWLLGGLGIGLVIAAGAYLKGKNEALDEANTPATNTVEIATPPAPPKVIKPTAEVEATETNNRFDFYHLLSELEVIIPASEIKAMQEDIAPKENVSYFLQAGAFRKFEDADRRKAELALLAIEAEVKDNVHEGKTWFRILVGPFKNMRQLNQARNRIESNNINTLTIKKNQ